jgi:ribosomal protein S12 methylthiotransferase accessory factor
VFVPALPTYFNFHATCAERFCQVTSSGLAAGESFEDAALRATLELIERDAFMMTWLCQLPAARIALDDDVPPPVREIARQLGEHGASVELYSLSAGVPVPVIACLAIGDGERWPGTTVSLGAHPDPSVALSKAVLEQGHVGPYIRRLMKDENVARPSTPDGVRTLNDHALYYVPVERRPAFDFLRAAAGEGVGLSALGPGRPPTWEGLSESLAAEAVRVAVADVTSPDLRSSPFAVARALGTFLQPIDFGYALRRLASPRLERHAHAGINPDPHPVA